MCDHWGVHRGRAGRSEKASRARSRGVGNEEEARAATVTEEGAVAARSWTGSRESGRSYKAGLG